MSASVHGTSRDLQCPVWMFSVQITVLRDHLRLYPQTEFQSKSMDLLCKCGKSAFNLLFIYFPVAKCTPVIVSLSKPSVIHDKHIQSDIFCLFCNVVNLICVKIKISCFPVIYQDWSWLLYIFAADQIASVCIMIDPGKLSETFC